MDYTCREYWNTALNASLCKFLILRTVCAQPAHGYGIIQRVAELTGNLCAPSQGTVYPVLREFENCGCVRSRVKVVGGRERKVYEATARGRRALESGMGVWRQGLARLQAALKESPARARKSHALRVDASASLAGRHGRRQHQKRRS